MILRNTYATSQLRQRPVVGSHWPFRWPETGSYQQACSTSSRLRPGSAERSKEERERETGGRGPSPPSLVGELWYRAGDQVSVVPLPTLHSLGTPELMGGISEVSCQSLILISFLGTWQKMYCLISVVKGIPYKETDIDFSGQNTFDLVLDVALKLFGKNFKSAKLHEEGFLQIQNKNLKINKC